MHEHRDLIHRNKTYFDPAAVWKAKDDRHWVIGGIEHGIAYLNGAWWLICAHFLNERNCTDIGPFDSFKAALFTVTLLDES